VFIKKCRVTKIEKQMSAFGKKKSLILLAGVEDSLRLADMSESNLLVHESIRTKLRKRTLVTVRELTRLSMKVLAQWSWVPQLYRKL